MITVANRSQIANRQSAIANPRPTELAGALRSSLSVYHHDAFIQLWTGEAEVISYLARAVLQQDRTPLNVTVKFSSSMPLPGSSVTMGLLRMNNSGSAP